MDHTPTSRYDEEEHDLERLGEIERAIELMGQERDELAERILKRLEDGPAAHPKVISFIQAKRARARP